MKTLYIIRHAKSSWSFDISDMDRPLNTKGRMDVIRIAKYMSEHENTPDLLISSPASRALYTALFMADEWGYSEDEIRLAERLYHATTDSILEVLSEVDDAHSVAIFGHNPGFTDLINSFHNQYLDNFPTCGVFAFNFNIQNWREIHHAKATKKMDISPKSLRSK